MNTPFIATDLSHFKVNLLEVNILMNFIIFQMSHNIAARYKRSPKLKGTHPKRKRRKREKPK